MTFSEKSAAINEPERFKWPSAIYTFSEVVDLVCERLMDRQIQYSIRRIQEMDARLGGLERELDDFLFQKKRDLE